jgi:hypothetical protein
MWVSTLVGNEVNQTSLISILLPLTACVPMGIAALVMKLRYRYSYQSEDLGVLVMGLMACILIPLLAIQSCGAIAREKKSHTAEFIACTPSGGWKMIFWKGGGVLLSQVLSIVIFLLLITFVRERSVMLRHLPVRLLGALTLIFLTISLGMSFSLVSKTPLSASALLFMSVLILPIYVRQFLPEMLWKVVLNLGWAGPLFHNSREAAQELLCLAAMGIGVVLTLTRQHFGRFARIALGAGLAIVFGLGPDLVGGLFNKPIEPLDMLLGSMEVRRRHVALFVSLFHVLLSGMLIVGMTPRFTRHFLRGAGK